jgi:hypothetical protein
VGEQTPFQTKSTVKTARFLHFLRKGKEKIAGRARILAEKNPACGGVHSLVPLQVPGRCTQPLYFSTSGRELIPEFLTQILCQRFWGL